MTKIADLYGREDVRITLGPRPGKKSINRLQELGLTHCCTLLSEREGAALIEKVCSKIGTPDQPCAWVWLPVEGGNIHVLGDTDVRALMETLSDTIAQTPSPHLYLHCSAGIHRTGFFAYVLLRLLGRNATSALAELAALREVTADQVTPERIALAETVAVEILSKPDL